MVHSFDLLIMHCDVLFRRKMNLTSCQFRKHIMSISKALFPSTCKVGRDIYVMFDFFFFKEILKKEKKRMRYNKMSTHKETE